MILAADIGGTTAHFACCRAEGKEIRILFERQYRSRDFPSLEGALAAFLQACAAVPALALPPEGVCLALAGPVTTDGCHLVNLGWRVSREGLQKAFPQLPPILLVNDLVATGHGLPFLAQDELLPLSRRQGLAAAKAPPGEGNSRRVILAPGTGLGIALLLGGQVLASEGAHADFAPRDELELRLWRFLRRQYGHVSYERILSGPGLCQLERFFRLELQGAADAPPLEAQEVTGLAMREECRVCQAALSCFVRILGAKAGNLALSFLPEGGIYLGGGIPPKILPALQSEAFLRAFSDKGRFSALVEEIPLFVIREPRSALFGAAALAAAKSLF